MRLCNNSANFYNDTFLSDDIAELIIHLQVCCSPDNQTYCDLPRTKWIPTPIVANTSTSVTVSYQPCAGQWIVGLRYAWRESPCAFKQCAVYSKENALPMAPFLANGLFNSGKVTQFNDQRHISAP